MLYKVYMPATGATDTRALILQTARELLRRYGPDKLAVVDIARALNMSHANVYRFFRTKAEILDAIIDEWLAKLQVFVESIARRPAPASQRITSVVLELHRKRKQKLREDAEVFETYRRVVEIRPDMAARRRAEIIRVFIRLLQDGIDAGEFAPIDTRKCAIALKDATSLFLHPLMIPTILHEPTDERARNVVRLFLAGLSRPNAAARNHIQRPGKSRSARTSPPAIKRRRSRLPA